jgi:hypothetical protein
VATSTVAATPATATPVDPDPGTAATSPGGSLPAPSPTPAATPDTTALPVALELAGPHADGVRRWVEGVLGWQPVDTDTSELVPAALRLCDVAGAGAGSARPTVLLVADDEAPSKVAEVAARARPDLVVPWPAGRDDLPAQVAGMLAAHAPPAGQVRVLRVGGTAGGTGTSTVALALAGLAGWSGLRTLVAVGAGAPVDDGLLVPADAVAAPDLWRRASVLPGVPQARVVRVADRGCLPEPAATEPEVTVLDVGVATDVDVLVCRADAAGLDAVSRTTAAIVVVNGDGPASAAAVRRACGHRRHLCLPRSARVARAGLHRRVPTSLPGSWLRPLTPLVPRRAGPG